MGPTVIISATTAMNLPAQTSATLPSLNEADGASPSLGLLQVTSGNSNGTTCRGGAKSPGPQGDRFRFKRGPMTTTTSARVPAAAMLAAVLVTLAPARVAPAQQTFKVLLSFDKANGSYPTAGLVQGFDGNLYGTASSGGPNTAGTVFKLSPAGRLTTLYSFCAQTNCTDGYSPDAGLARASDGNFYGTTYYGGNTRNGVGWGTVFKTTSTGMLTTLYSFCAQSGCPDGANPSGLVLGPDGNFYGTTFYGGVNGSGFCSGCGTVFRITAAGQLTTLYSFCAQTDCTDGFFPIAGLVLGADGNFYGTTTGGGDNPGTECNRVGCGTVFKITPAGKLTTLHSFCSAGCADGFFPAAGLIQADDGNFYGTTEFGGANLRYGTVFRITAAGSLTRLYSFCAQPTCADGAFPVTSLVQATDGNLYGTTETGGGLGVNGGSGTVYRITLQGNLTSLHSFDGSDGYRPDASLAQATNGVFYAAVLNGGSDNTCSLGCGVVFGLDESLKPFIATQPSFGKPGTPVKILGTNLTGATSVTFNGVEAAFTVISPSLISTAVPDGATSGKVQVTKPGGTLTSNVSFRVKP